MASHGAAAIQGGGIRYMLTCTSLGHMIFHLVEERAHLETPLGALPCSAPPSCICSSFVVAGG